VPESDCDYRRPHGQQNQQRAEAVAHRQIYRWVNSTIINELMVSTREIAIKTMAICCRLEVSCPDCSRQGKSNLETLAETFATGNLEGR
jgi:hypothetical protein